MLKKYMMKLIIKILIINLMLFYIKFHPKKVIYAKDAEKLKVIKNN